jgi:pentatricopeptide repeat protein
MAMWMKLVDTDSDKVENHIMLYTSALQGYGQAGQLNKAEEWLHHAAECWLVCVASLQQTTSFGGKKKLF